MKKTAIILLLYLASFFALGSLFKINIIECSIEGNNCDNELYRKLDSIKGKSIFLFDIENELSLEKFKDETVLLKKYQKKIPGTLILDFSREKLLYKLVKNEQELFISEFGKILPNNQGESEFIIVNIKNDVDSTKHNQIKTIIQSSESKDIKIKNIDWNSDQEIIINFENKPKIITDYDSIEKTSLYLKMILNSREIQDVEGEVKEIDFRFNLPVLRTSQ